MYPVGLALWEMGAPGCRRKPGMVGGQVGGILTNGPWWAWRQWALKASGVDWVGKLMLAVVGTRRLSQSSGEEEGAEVGLRGRGSYAQLSRLPAGSHVLFCPIGQAPPLGLF